MEEDLKCKAKAIKDAERDEDITKKAAYIKKSNHEKRIRGEEKEREAKSRRSYEGSEDDNGKDQAEGGSRMHGSSTCSHGGWNESPEGGPSNVVTRVKPAPLRDDSVLQNAEIHNCEGTHHGTPAQAVASSIGGESDAYKPLEKHDGYDSGHPAGDDIPGKPQSPRSSPAKEEEEQDRLRKKSKNNKDETHQDTWTTANSKGYLVLDFINITSITTSGQIMLDRHSHCTTFQEHKATEATLAGWKTKARAINKTLIGGPLDPEKSHHTGGVGAVCTEPFTFVPLEDYGEAYAKAYKTGRLIGYWLKGPDVEILNFTVYGWTDGQNDLGALQRTDDLITIAEEECRRYPGAHCLIT